MMLDTLKFIGLVNLAKCEGLEILDDARHYDALGVGAYALLSPALLETARVTARSMIERERLEAEGKAPSPRERARRILAAQTLVDLAERHGPATLTDPARFDAVAGYVGAHAAVDPEVMRPAQNVVAGTVNIFAI